MNVGRLELVLERPGASRKDRRRSRAELAQARHRQRVVERKLAAITGPETARLDAEERRLDGRLSELRTQSIEHRAWIDRHPEAARRLDQLTTEIDALDQRLDRGRGVPQRAVGLDREGTSTRSPVTRGRDLGIDLGR